MTKKLRATGYRPNVGSSYKSSLQEKTMEEKLKELFLEHTNIDGLDGEIYPASCLYEETVEFIKDLQDSFRRKVEEEVIGNYIKNFQEWRDWVDEQYEAGRKDKKSRVLVPYYTWLDEKQRAKLKNIK